MGGGGPHTFFRTGPPHLLIRPWWCLLICRWRMTFCFQIGCSVSDRWRSQRASYIHDRGGLSGRAYRGGWSAPDGSLTCQILCWNLMLAQWRNHVEWPLGYGVKEPDQGRGGGTGRWVERRTGPKIPVTSRGRPGIRIDERQDASWCGWEWGWWISGESPQGPYDWKLLGYACYCNESLCIEDTAKPRMVSWRGESAYTS